MNYSLLVLAPLLAPIALFVIMFLGMTFLSIAIAIMFSKRK